MEPKGPRGWISEELAFGRYITSLFGPNGCGKTPLIQSIIYSLGYPVNFREDILNQCRAIVLTLGNESRNIEIRRTIGTGNYLDVAVLENGEIKQFYNAADYSKFILELFGFGAPVLTTTGGDPTAPYMATLLPIFYLDQDHGYNRAYYAQATFIKDQYGR